MSSSDQCNRRHYSSVLLWPSSNAIASKASRHKENLKTEAEKRTGVNPHVHVNNNGDGDSAKAVNGASNNNAGGGDIDEGFVVGWEEINEWNNLTSGQNNENTKKTVRTAVCAGIVSYDQILPISDEANSNSKEQNQKERILNRAIHLLSKQYKCCSKEKLSGENKKIGKANGIKTGCDSDPCVIYCSLKIIGVWKPSFGKAETEIMRDEKSTWTTATGDESCAPPSSLPVFIPTPIGPWWCQCDENDNGESHDGPQQLVYYDPFQNSLDYFCHARFSGDEGNGREPVRKRVRNGNRYQMDRMLLRLNESHHVATELENILKELQDEEDSSEMVSSESEILSNLAAPPSTKENNHNKSVNMKTESASKEDTTPFFQKLKQKSLTSIHHKHATQDLNNARNKMLLTIIDDSHSSQHTGPNSSWITPCLQLCPLVRCSSFFSCWMKLQRLQKERCKRMSYRNHKEQHKEGKHLITNETLSNQSLYITSSMIRCLVDSTLGIIIGLYTIMYAPIIRHSISHLWNHTIHTKLLCDNIQWLETFPVGFKLNVPLTKFMGREILMLIEVYNYIFMHIGGGKIQLQYWALCILGILSITCGITFLLAVMFDLLRLATIHLQLISYVFRTMYQCELHALSSLWKLFRGKKRNVLRHRTDTLENSYDSMQLLLGIILFTICLFLYTTILVYYVFFVVVVEAGIVFGLIQLWWLWLVIQRLPLGEIVARLRSPGRFGNAVFFETLDDTHTRDSSHRSIARIISLPEPSSMILSRAFGGHVSSFLKCVPSFVLEIFSGAPCSALSVCISISSSLQGDFLKNQ